ncbi:MAG TPA: trypsin-like peptidase domain-containing protein [Ktedonobacteraceae bacterium]|nr:trypsin-like peptidase domain-containing protein [Ktedonobacteraceae bacterium]
MIPPNINNRTNQSYQPVRLPYWPEQQETNSPFFQQTMMSPPVYIPPAGSRQAPPSRPRKSRFGAVLVLIVVIMAVLGIGGFSGWAFAMSSAATSTAASTTQATTQVSTTAQNATTSGTSNVETVRESAIAKAEPTVVQIDATTAQGQSIGSGVIIDKRGYIVTNNHVVSGAQSINVMLSDGTQISNAQIVGTAASSDLAVLKIQAPANIAIATIGDSSKLQIGEEVLAIGNPLGITQTATRGIVSALNRNVSEQTGATIKNAIQTDAAINPGNSGGALVDLQGNLVGIPTLGAVDPETNTPANGVGFAIPSNQVKTVVTQIIQGGA